MVSVSASCGQSEDATSERPNIIVVMADDLGYSDLGCYGGEIETPNLDTLAKDGVRFSQFYNASRCCPTRASLLTGKYPHEVGLRFNGRNLSRDVPTVAEVLKTAGYHTAMVGKWHLSRTDPYSDEGFDDPDHMRWLNRDPSLAAKPFADLDSYPAARGFETHYGVIWGVVNYFNPFSLVENFEPVAELPEDYYLTDAINVRSAEIIREMAMEDAPFFLYIAHTAPHWPLHAREEDLAKYRGKYDEGWSVLRRNRYARQIELGLVNPEIAPLPELNRGSDSNWGVQPEWNALTGERKALESRRMEAHAAMIDRMDQGLGDVFDALRETGQWNNTVILFLSDNGASPEQVRLPGYDRPSKTRDGRVIAYEGELDMDNIGHEESSAGIGPAWANAVNTPFRYWKKESFEGGNHTPAILHWSRLSDEALGGIVEDPYHVVDILPTILEVSGAEYPNRIREHALSKLQGKAFVQKDGDLFAEDGMEPRKLYFEHEGGAALRAGDWKLVKLKDGPWQLFNLKHDATEMNDLSDQHSELKAEMIQDWEAWFERVTESAN